MTNFINLKMNQNMIEKFYLKSFSIKCINIKKINHVDMLRENTAYLVTYF